MLLFSVNNPKSFMNFLFKDSFLNCYETRGIILQTYTRFEINCLYDEAFNQEAPAKSEEAPARYCNWSEMQPAILFLVKGKKPPRLLKIIFCLSGAEAVNINENAAALFITVKYEQGRVSILTGTAQKQFSLEKSVDNDWDDYVKKLFLENGFEILLEEDE